MELLGYEKEHLDTLRQYLPECMVLLKTNGDFPLEQAGSIALYGNGARRTLKGGTGSGEVNSRFFVTIEEGLEQAGFYVTTKEWLNAYDKVCTEAKQAFLQEIRARAKAKHTNPAIEGMGAVMPEPEYELPLDGEGNVAIYVLSRICGEGNDRKPVKGDWSLSETEKRDILALQKKYQKFMLVLNVGGAMDMSELVEVENILLLSQLGTETGAALADVLLGKQTPSGKLTTTWSEWKDYAPMEDFGDINDTHYKEGIYVGYRYFDSMNKKALFPFGYGLSYTTFSQKVQSVSLKKDVVKVQVEVENTGKFTGKEVVQLYLSCPQGKLDKEWQSLVALEKTKALMPGETQNLELSFRLRDFASYDTENARYILEKGEYILRVGNSSVDTSICGVVTVEEDMITRQLKNCCGTTDFTDWKPEKVRQEKDIPEECPRFTLDKQGVEAQTVQYDYEYEIDPMIASLTEDELSLLNVGAFNAKAGVLNIIGNSAITVAGAAGESASILKEKGFPSLVMADGPAGLRLSRDYIKDEKGAHAIGTTMPETIAELLPPIARWFMSLLETKPKKGQTIYHHYMTAIPIGTAIAQSWNLEFARVCGDIVGDEMERTGVNLWLAPALNIHRNVLCGRNFEYYSEDPMVSGYFAAAVTKGVQSHKGCGTTIKHFAANNQETNRYNSNSVVNERALREIYLKGFEICVREAQPHALMTSYNLLNGVHTSESRELTEDILRREFGYEGIVMTDWIVPADIAAKGSIYSAPSADKIAVTGCELIMPGGKADVDNIKKALENGALTRKQLEINATRLYRMAKKLNS